MHSLSLSLSLYVSFSVSTYSSYLYPMYPLSLSLTGCLFSILCAILSPLCIVVSLFPPMSNVSFSLSSLSLCLITTYCVSLSLSSWWLLFYFLLSVVHIPSLTSMSYSPYLLNRFLSFFMYCSICLSFIWEQYITTSIILTSLTDEAVNIFLAGTNAINHFCKGDGVKMFWRRIRVSHLLSLNP